MVCPSWKQRPTLFVEYDADSFGDLKDRCDDMRTLNPLEQSAQIFFIRSWYEIRNFILDYRNSEVENGRVLTTALEKILEGMEDTMKKAQKKWKLKFGERVCDKIIRVLTNSPKPRLKGSVLVKQAPQRSSLNQLLDECM